MNKKITSLETSNYEGIVIKSASTFSTICDVPDLGPYKDIEEELGINLITFFKALKNGIYYFVNGNQLTKDYVILVDNYLGIGIRDKLSYSFVTAFGKQILLFNDYGRTWALTKEELL